MADMAVLCVATNQSDSTKPWKRHSPFRMSRSRWEFSVQ